MRYRRVPAVVWSPLQRAQDHMYIAQMFAQRNRGLDPFTAPVSLQQFANLWTWLGPVFHTIARVHNHWLCVRPVVIHGFVGKVRARCAATTATLTQQLT